MLVHETHYSQIQIITNIVMVVITKIDMIFTNKIVTTLVMGVSPAPPPQHKRGVLRLFYTSSFQTLLCLNPLHWMLRFVY